MRCNQKPARRQQPSFPASPQNPSQREPGKRAARTDPRTRIRYLSSAAGNHGKKPRRSLSSLLLHESNKNFFERGSAHFKLQDRRLTRNVRKPPEQRSFFALKHHLDSVAINLKFHRLQRLKFTDQLSVRVCKQKIDAKHVGGQFAQLRQAA